MRIRQSTEARPSQLLFSAVVGSLMLVSAVLSTPLRAAGTVPQLFTVTALPSELVKTAVHQEEINPDIVRTQYVRVNAKVLQAEGPIGLNLFSDAFVTATRSRLESRSVNRYSWFGRTEASPPGQVVLVFENGVLVGEVRTATRVYRIAYIGSGVHAIREIRDSIRIDWPPLAPVCCAVLRNLPPGLLPAIIDTLVVYTPRATTAAGGHTAMEAQIQLAIDWTNEAYRNSGIRQSLRLATAYEVVYTEPSNLWTKGADVLAHLINPSDGQLDDVHRVRNKVGADLVSLWCEFGCRAADFYNSLPERTFSVVNWDSPREFAQELGRNMGADYDRPNASGAAAFPYSYGYTEPNGAFHDIMSFGTECGFLCPLIPYFSNPNVTFNGVPTGRPDGSVDSNGNPNSADDARTLNETSATIASFRQPPAMIAIPASGGTLTCCQLTFTAQSRANTDYYWMLGTARHMSDVAWVGTGTTRSVTVNVPASLSGQTLWVRLYTQVWPAGAWYFRDHTYTIQ